MSQTQQIWANGRFLTQPLTGIQRYALNMVSRMPLLKLISSQPAEEAYKSISDDRIVVKHGCIHGHVWEQGLLPFAIPNGSILWSPTSIGPLLYKRNVVTIHDISYLDNPEWFSPIYVALYSNLQPLVIHKSVHIVAVSEYTKQRIIELCKVSEDKISVIYEGCDDIFKPQDPVSVKSVLEDIGIRGRYILALGAVSPRKNFSRQLAAWKSIADRYKDVELVIVGKNGLQFSGENELGVLPNRTRHLTTVDDNFLVKLMAGATALLYASLYEGFGLPIIEAMNTGTPVMTGNITSMPEIAGNAALLVDPYNIDEIANGICRLLDDDGLRCQLRDKGFERVKMFTWDNAAQRTWDLLKTLA